MDRKQQAALAESFRAMHQESDVLLLPNAWDAMSARLFGAAGFRAIATSSAGVAWALGYPDGEAAPWGEVLAATARIVRVAGGPVSADIEGGYGGTPAEVGLHVAAAIRAGVVGINLEDGVAGGLRPLDEMVARLRAAREVARREGVPIVLNARSDLMLQQGGERSAKIRALVERCRAYVAAGADCVYPFGLADAETIGMVAKAVAAPVNVAGRPGMADAAALGRLGVARVTIAAAPALATMASIRTLAETLRNGGSFEGLGSGFSYAEAQALFSNPT